MNKALRKELAVICGFGAAALWALKQKKAAALLGTSAGILLATESKSVNFYGQSVVITGGSRGLGLALAKRLVFEGAKVALLARDEKELQRAVQMLKEFNSIDVLTIACDVTNDTELHNALTAVVTTFGSIDLLINNAGAIMVSPFEFTTKKDFEAQMALHLYAPMSAIRWCLPHLLKSPVGRIVNICSMGGKVAVPHMLPYDTSKFALAGFSQGITAEFEQLGLPVTTVYPALMKTGSPIQAVFKGDHEKEFAWFAAADVFPGISLEADEAAKKIIAAAKEGQQELVLSGLAQLRMGTATIFPELMAYLMARINRWMPKGPDKGKSMTYKTGYEARRIFEEKEHWEPLRAEAAEAEAKYNQIPKTDGAYNLGLKNSTGPRTTPIA
ncbi:MAG: SDR family oxidoreductase [Bdellovibrionota bacterium]